MFPRLAAHFDQILQISVLIGSRVGSYLVSPRIASFNVPVLVNLPPFIGRLGLVRRRKDGKEISSRAVNRAY